MVAITELDVINFFKDSAYAPLTVYSAIFIFMYASAFGLPLPEEVPLIGAGLVGHIAHNPEQYPPPHPGAARVNLYLLAFLSLIAVLTSDLVIFFLGRYMGKKFHSSARFKRVTDGATYKRIQARIKKNGALASGIFRFTPGLRFPGHMACGAFGLPLWKFVAVDGGAALITVPTQVLLVGIYGDTILKNFSMLKYFVIGVVGIFFLVKLVSKITKTPSNLDAS